MTWKVENIIGGVHHLPDGSNIVVTGRKPSYRALINCHMVGLIACLDNWEIGEVEWVEQDGMIYGAVL